MTRAKDISKVITAPVLSGLTYPATDGSANQFMKTDGSGTLSFATVDLSSLSPIAGSSSIVTTGALNSGSITSGFGTINTGSSNITTTGVGTFGSLDIDGAVDMASTLAVGNTITVTENNANASTDIVIINSNGVATVGNQAKLHLGATGTTSHGASIIGQFTGTANSNHATDLIFKTTTTGSSLAEVLRITSAGNVGIGTSPSASLHVYRATGDASLIIETGQDSGSVEPTLYLISYATNANPAIRFGDRVGNNGFIEYENSDDSLRFGANASERMRILSGGQVLCNATALLGNGTLHVDAGSNIYCLVARANATNGALILFQKDDGSGIGSIDHTASATRYLTSSDYRLKENVVTSWDATTRLKQLKPSRFNFIIDASTTVDGFLAHEVSSVVPEAVSGTKDAVDADGNAVMQGIDQSKLVPLLVKTIQELEARITLLENGE